MKSIPVTRLPAGQLEARETHRLAIEEEQGNFLSRALEIDPGIQVLGRVQLVLNAVLAQVDTEALAAISRDPAVLRVSPVRDYELALSETVTYIGARRVHDQGVDGSGIRVAVLDTGIDYNHSNLSGPGTLEAYESDYGTTPSDSRNTITDGLFPTEKVIGALTSLGKAGPMGHWPPTLTLLISTVTGLMWPTLLAERKVLRQGRPSML
jgi:subtilisin family serine protease